MARADDDDRAGATSGIMKIPGAADRIDDATFEQILEMDDDEEERDFSRSIVYDFFSQAESTFSKMDLKLQSKDLKTLSELGHFLKGSSATLGLTKVKDECEKIQHYGQKKDASGTKDLSSEDALTNLKTAIDTAKKEFSDVEKVLKQFYHDDA